MFGEENNLKDSKSIDKDTLLSLSDTQVSLSYKKTSKLVTALFMVTDMMENAEPIRLKLRALGVDILSDTTSITRAKLLSRTEVSIDKKVQEVLYFLDIAETVNLMTRMNSSILKKEFLDLQKSIFERVHHLNSFSGKATLSEFFNAEERFSITPAMPHEKDSTRHITPTRIGVQKGSTLLKALSDRMSVSPLEKKGRPIDTNNDKGSSNFLTKAGFDLLKKERRNEIVRVIKECKGVASIMDIKSHLSTGFNGTSEKTLQRELVSMVADGLLNKTGSKRWSRYSVS